MIKVFDIETIPNVDVWQRMDPPAVKYGNTKDVEKRKEMEDKAIKRQIEGMGLSPFTGRICAYWVISFDPLQKEQPDSKGKLTYDLSDASEKIILKELISDLGLDKFNDSFLVSFNGMEFDIPFIYGRSMLLGLDALKQPLGYWTKKFSNEPHYDIRKVLTNWEYQAKGSLDYFCKMILNKSKDEPPYSEFLNMYKAKKQAAILESCKQHVQMTYELYKKIKPYY